MTEVPFAFSKFNRRFNTGLVMVTRLAGVKQDLGICEGRKRWK